MKKEKLIPVEEPQEAPEKIEKEPEDTQPEEQKTSKRAKITKVGSMLKEVRLQKDLKLADVAKQLCIRRHYIEAIEDSNYADIPAFPYGIGFIRSYAKFLGLNSENIVDLYKEETHVSEPVDMHVLEPQPEASMPSFQYVLVSIAAIALLYIGWLMYNRSTAPVEETVVEETDSTNSGGVIIVEDFNADQLEPETKAVLEEASVPETELQVTITDEPYQAEEEKNDEKKDLPQENSVSKEPATIPSSGVFIEVLKETWVEVKDDSKLYLSKVLQEGDTYTVPEGNGMILSVGKEDGVKVYINGTETAVVRPTKKMNIALDEYLNNNH